MRYQSATTRIVVCLLLYTVSCSSCFTYRVTTHAQATTDNTPANSRKACSLFWGIINKPQVITTPVCDSLGVNGVSEVVVKTNFGNALVTILTLGIYCPVRVEWKCAKPCRQTQTL